MSTEDEVRAVKRRHSARLLAQPGVVGVGIVRDQHGGFALSVHVVAEADGAGLGEVLDGVPVRTEVTGRYRKQAPDTRDDSRTRHGGGMAEADAGDPARRRQPRRPRRDV